MQLETEREQARHPHWFVAGARPATTWIFNIALAYSLFVAPFLQWCIGMVAWAAGSESIPAYVNLPQLDWDQLLAVIGGAGGLYGFRSWEKRRGTARENLSHPSPQPPPKVIWPTAPTQPPPRQLHPAG